MRIAVLGATSQIARDLAPLLLQQGHDLSLFARSPQRLASSGLCGKRCTAGAFDAFAGGSFDAVVNCVGVGDPARAAAMGSAILEVTRTYDDLALDYVRAHEGCRYIFLSSGAAYGGAFESPVDENSPAVLPLNAMTGEHWYGLAKLTTEGVHRAHANLAIVDLRVFSYFSHTQDLAARFLITDILRSIVQGSVLSTSADFIVRDFVHPADLHSLVECVLAAPAMNNVLDVYSRAPVDKPTLLAAMRDRFGLRYETAARPPGVNATGAKSHYYSLNRRAAAYGYAPRFTSFEGVLHESQLALALAQGLA